MLITADQVRRIAKSPPNASNMKSAIGAINEYGASFGLDLPHRLAHFLAQEMHESGAFKYDQEIWGPTAAQKRYDTRVDLGNTPEKDGDGKRLKGRGPIQVTGGTNYRKLTKWAKLNFPDRNPPDFYKNPDLLNTDPWEGLSAIWYWDSGNPTGKSLNRYADENNIEMITKRINGGLNGYADRLSYYDRIALVFLGFGVNEIAKFQRSAQAKGWLPKNTAAVKYDDGLSGPQTRAAMHRGLVDLAGKKDIKVEDPVKASPIVEKETKTVTIETEVKVPEPVPVKVESLDKPWYKDMDGVKEIAVGVGTPVVTAITGAPWQTVAVVAIAVLLGFGVWYLIRRKKSAAQNAEVARIESYSGS